jgi:hypothetical protein
VGPKDHAGTRTLLQFSNHRRSFRSGLSGAQPTALGPSPASYPGMKLPFTSIQFFLLFLPRIEARFVGHYIN